MGTILFYSNNLQWVNCFTSQSGRLHVVRMELLCNMPHQSIGLDRVLSDSGQHSVDLSLSRNYNLDGAQTLSRTHLLWLKHSKLARASNNLAVGSIEFFVTRINSWGFEPHQKLHFWIGVQLFTVTMFFGSHVLRMKAEQCFFFATVLTPSDAPVDEYRLKLWQWAQNQFRIQFSLSFTGGAGCSFT